MATPSFSTEAGRAGNYPAFRFNQRERKLLASAKAYLDAGLSGSQIANDAISLEHLDSGIEFTHRVVAAGTFTTAGGDANESITVAGALNTDHALVVIKTLGAAPVTLLTSASAAGAINLVFSADPSTDHVVTYMLLRAAS